MTRTLDEIRRDGLAALREKLGRAGLIRFLQQFELGTGDYARERRKWVDATSFDDLQSLAGRPRVRRRRAPVKKSRRVRLDG